MREMWSMGEERPLISPIHRLTTTQLAQARTETSKPMFLSALLVSPGDVLTVML